MDRYIKEGEEIEKNKELDTIERFRSAQHMYKQAMKGASGENRNAVLVSGAIHLGNAAKCNAEAYIKEKGKSEEHSDVKFIRDEITLALKSFSVAYNLSKEEPKKGAIKILLKNCIRGAIGWTGKHTPKFRRGANEDFIALLPRKIKPDAYILQAISLANIAASQLKKSEFGPCFSYVDDAHESLDLAAKNDGRKELDMIEKRLSDRLEGIKSAALAYKMFHFGKEYVEMAGLHSESGEEQSCLKPDETARKELILKAIDMLRDARQYLSNISEKIYKEIAGATLEGDIAYNLAKLYSKVAYTHDDKEMVIQMYKKAIECAVKEKTLATENGTLEEHKKAIDKIREYESLLSVAKDGEFFTEMLALLSKWEPFTNREFLLALYDECPPNNPEHILDISRDDISVMKCATIHYHPTSNRGSGPKEQFFHKLSMMLNNRLMELERKREENNLERTRTDTAHMPRTDI